MSHARWTSDATDDLRLPLNDDSLVGHQAGDHPFLVLYTDDLDAVRDALKKREVTIWAEQHDPHSRSFHFRDLYGNVIIAAQLLSSSTRPCLGLALASHMSSPVFRGRRPWCVE